MFLQRVHTPGLAHISYLIGSGGHAAVIDPRRDCAVYADIARREGLRITHIFETHRNEDFVTGSADLSRLTGAEIYHGKDLPFTFGNPISGGATFDVGDLRLSVLSTPGHTFESICLVLADLDFGPDPVGVFTGDTLFVGEVGRTDFYPAHREQVAGLLYDSIFEKILPLGDHVMIFPAHGAGSVCGGRLAAREISTIGYERRHNPRLNMSRPDFIAAKSAEHHYQPHYFKKMEEYNLSGPPPLADVPEPSPFSADEFASAIADGMLVLDVRSPEAFGGAHLPASLAIPLDMISRFAGYLLPFDTPIGLVVDDTAQMQAATTSLRRIGYDRTEAYLQDGMHDWETGGREFEGIPQIYIGEIKRRIDEGDQFTLLDVRTEAEFTSGHLSGATNIYVGELPDRLEEVPGARPITTFCGSGHRAIVAASILQKHGFDRVENCLGSMMACHASGCPLVKD